MTYEEVVWGTEGEEVGGHEFEVREEVEGLDVVDIEVVDGSAGGASEVNCELAFSDFGPRGGAE